LRRGDRRMRQRELSTDQIFHNQANIEKNQKALDEILLNQKEILANQKAILAAVKK